MRFSFSTPREITRGLKRIWESKMGTPSSASIILDVYLALKALEIVYRKNGADVEGIVDGNGHRHKVVGERKIVSWEVAQTKGKGRERKLNKKAVLSNLFVEVVSEGKKNISEFFPDITVCRSGHRDPQAYPL